MRSLVETITSQPAQAANNTTTSKSWKDLFMEWKGLNVQRSVNEIKKGFNKISFSFVFLLIIIFLETPARVVALCQ